MFNDRLDLLPDYPFARLGALLRDVAPPAGRPTLNLAVGEPQHGAPALLTEALEAASGTWNRYPPIAGTDALRTAAAAWLTRRYRLADGLVDPLRHVVAVAGTREALFLAALLTVPTQRRGKVPAVLVPNPSYAVYQGAGILAGAELVPLPTGPDSGFLPDLEALSPGLLDRTALFYLCSPSNPEGAVASRDYLSRAIALARRHGFVLALDECYAEIYDGAPPAGGLEMCGGALDNLLLFHSLSKRSSAAGLRSGFIAGDARLIAGMIRLRNYAGATLPLPVQAASVALWADEAHVEANRAAYREKFALAERLLSNRLGFVRPAGGFFLWLDVGDGEAATRALWAGDGIRVLPGGYMTIGAADAANPGRRYIRAALVHEPAVLAGALAALADRLAPPALARVS